MAFFDRVFVGKVLKDFGVLDERRRGIAKQKMSVLLTERGSQRYLVIKTSSFAWLAAGVQYVEIPVDAIPQLEQWLQEIRALGYGVSTIPR